MIKKELKITEAIQVCLTLNYSETKEREINGLLEALQAHHLTQGLILTLDEEGEEVITVDSNKTYMAVATLNPLIILR
ncbi:MAG: hypothetical protein JSS53_03060 [Proteobacteria bacterium]|nr:hypothetical protein [Pseudomonadota bacterium]